jgi:transcriptional regulator with PAS, ATPase and Fis domain
VFGPPLVLRDLGSANGVRVNGVPLASKGEVELANGAWVEMGQATLLVQTGGAAAEPSKTMSGARNENEPAPMDRLSRLVEMVGPSNLNVLVLGETGAGKDVIAERLHARSPRAKGPIVRLNCAALAENLIDSELFGHERGAFTGAVGAKAGLIERASGGTLFLDEVGDMPASTQAKLLRVIEQRQVRRVGGLDDRPIDVRFVAATHRDIRAMIEAGAFRRDLYFRLNGITLVVPPLRERRSEILPLARTFAKDVSLTSSAERVLLDYDWPGNVRELKATLERAVVLSGGTTIEPSHLMLDEMTATPAPDARSLPDEVAGLERRRIEEALEKTGGNQTKAAELLGISRRAFVNRLEAFDFPRPRRGKRDT